MNEKITFYGEEVFSSKFVEKASALESGFVANSFFVGIIGSIVTECLFEPERLKDHIEMYQEIADEDAALNVEGFLLYLYNNYDGFSSTFKLDETFSTETYRRISDKTGLQYINKKVTATLKDVDVWDMNRLLQNL